MGNTSKITLLDAVPERLVEWEMDNNKDVAVLLVPKFRRGLLKRWLQPRLKRPFVRIRLDDVGSAVWENCDGVKTVREIGMALEEKFGERIKPVDQRIGQFFDTLYKNQFVRYWQDEESTDCDKKNEKQ